MISEEEKQLFLLDRIRAAMHAYEESHIYQINAKIKINVLMLACTKIINEILQENEQ